MKMGQIGCPETSVLNQPTLRNNPEDGIICCLAIKKEVFLEWAKKSLFGSNWEE
jgi:hypothetical protein